MTEPHGLDDGFDFAELAGYLDDLQIGVDARVTEARLLGFRTQALIAIDSALDSVLDCPVLDDPVIHGLGTDIGHDAVTTPAPSTHLTAAKPHARTPGTWPSSPSPLPVPPIPVPPIPAPPLPSPLPMPPLPTEPVPAPPSSTPTWREPDNGGRDPGSRGVSKRQR